jgi:hypothetical protein
LKNLSSRSSPSWAPHKNDSLAISTTYLIILIETFRRRKDGEDWARDMERNIDRRGSPKPKAAAPVRTFGDTIDLYVEDMHEVGRPPRPKANLERLLERRPEGVFVNAFEIGLMKRAAAAIGAR